MCPRNSCTIRDTKLIKATLPFEDAVALTGYGWFNIYLLLASGLCLMVVIMETMGMMFVIPAAQCDLNLTLTEKSTLSAVSFLGVVSSSHLWGFLADSQGRKNVLLISMVMSFFTTLLSSFMPDPWIFIFIRYINGFFVGGSSAVVYAYVGEFHDKYYRPKVVSWIATFVAFGNMALPGLGWLILPQTFAYEIPFLGILFRPWRLLVISNGFLALIAAACIYKLPESPKYLLTEGKNSEALDILKRIFACNSGKKTEDFPVGDIIWDEEGAETNNKENGLFRSMWAQTVPLFRRNYLVKTFMVCMLQFGAFAPSSGLMMWYPEILNKMSHFLQMNPGKDVTVCGAINFFEEEEMHMPLNSSIREITITTCKDTVNNDVFVITLVIGSAFACLYILIGACINMIGNRNMLLGFYVVFTSFGLASQYVDGVELAQLFMGIFLLTATCIGIINTIVVELYPTQMRGMALAISLMAGRFGAVTGSHLTGPLIYAFCEYTFYVFAADHMILIIIILLLPSSKCKADKMTQPLE